MQLGMQLEQEGGVYAAHPGASGARPWLAERSEASSGTRDSAERSEDPSGTRPSGARPSEELNTDLVGETHTVRHNVFSD